MSNIKVAISGACGRVGREVVKMVAEQEDMKLVAVIDKNQVGEDIGQVVLGKKVGVKVREDLEAALEEASAEVMVDFTTPATVTGNALAAIMQDVRPVIGTTGMSPADLEELRGLCESKKLGAVVAPNFAIGAVLMMHFAKIAARYLPHAEILELHHDKKLDAPSGTSLKTAEMIAEGKAAALAPNSSPGAVEWGAAPGEGIPARGYQYRGVPIHSVRLPGLVAHQEVIFGGLEQTLTIRHDSLGRGSFMPGVALAIRKVMELDHLVYGLENLLELE